MGKYQIGDFVRSNNCGVFEVLSNTREDNKRLVKFLNTGFEYFVDSSSIHKGEVKDYSLPSVFGIGVTGTPNIDECDKQCYIIWCSMLKRCYYEKPDTRRNFNTYSQSIVSENFKHFKHFRSWCKDQIGFESKDDAGKTFQLDKDILIKGNKIYSEDTCCFVPAEINSIFTLRKNGRGNNPLGVYFNTKLLKYSASLSRNGNSKYLGLYEDKNSAFNAYKQAKECYIRETANKWRDQIDSRVYEALINYEVNIDD